jgi:hypothetical protein
MAALAPQRVPCNILTGPLGAGKSTAILKLLQARGDGNWAVLVNEMGDVGIDGVIAESGGAATAEVSGGCICCANGVAVRVALTRLLKKRPSRLLIEPSGLGHVAELSEHLQKEPLSNALELRAVACVVPCDRHSLLWAEAPLYRFVCGVLSGDGSRLWRGGSREIRHRRDSSLVCTQGHGPRLGLADLEPAGR